MNQQYDFEIFGDVDEEVCEKLIRALEAKSTQLGQLTFTVAIDSPGGSVIDGVRVLSAIRAFPGKVIAKLGTVVASMASVIALACDEVHVSSNTFLMLHPAYVSFGFGDSNELRTLADRLDQSTTVLAEAIAVHSKCGEEKVREYFSKETWFGYKELQEAFDHVVLDNESYINVYHSQDSQAFARMKEIPEQLAAKLREAPAVPVEEPAVPVEEPAVPVEEPAVPVEEPAVPVEAPIPAPVDINAHAREVLEILSKLEKELPAII